MTVDKKLSSITEEDKDVNKTKDDEEKDSIIYVYEIYVI